MARQKTGVDEKMIISSQKSDSGVLEAERWVGSEKPVVSVHGVRENGRAQKQISESRLSSTSPRASYRSYAHRHKMPEAVALQQRIVPGAPPPAPLSKSQRKKRKSKVKTGAEDSNDIDHPESPSTSVPDVPATAAVENAPDSGDVQKDAHAPEDAHPEAETPTLPDELKSSPVVELISKRLKATTKKMVEHIHILVLCPLFTVTRQG